MSEALQRLAISILFDAQINFSEHFLIGISHFLLNLILYILFLTAFECWWVFLSIITFIILLA